jgi:type II secretory pathway pseudopilin PulG
VNILARIKRLSKDESGMTLIDIAIVMMVIGLLLVPAIQTYNTWKFNRQVGTTSSNRLAINKAIADFFFINGVYPCPALPNLGPNDAAYGDSNCAGTNIDAVTRMGAVPWATLNIPASMALDGFKNKFTYAVSRHQTEVATWNTTGALLIRGRNSLGASRCENFAIYNINTVAHYIIVSHGASGVGARTAEGALRNACSGVTVDGENCDNDNTFVHDVCVANDNAGAEFYDDLTDYKFSTPSRLWQYAANPNNILVGGASSVGINNDNPQFQMDVVGNIRATNNSTGWTCDVNGANCFEARIIGGSGITCAAGATQGAMRGIAFNNARCVSGITAATRLCNTAIGEYVTGVDASGNVTCGI